MDLEYVVTHTDAIYKAMHRNGKKQYGAQLLEFMKSLGLTMDDRAYKLFDAIILDQKNLVPLQYREAVLFAVKREMVEHLIIERYMYDSYVMLVQALEKKR